MAAEAESAPTLDENNVFLPPMQDANPFAADAGPRAGERESVNNDRAGIGFAGGEGGGDADSPAPALAPGTVVPARAGRSQPPPTYTEVVRRTSGGRTLGDNNRLVETMPLLSSQSSLSTLAAREPTSGDHVRLQRGAARAILLWLGIGQWYSGLCIFFSFLFFSGGSVIIVLSFLTVKSLVPVKLTVVAAGILFILISVLWPCGWLWNQWNKTCGCSYAPFIAYAWTLSLIFTGIMGALFFGVNEHYDCVHFCKNCTFVPTEKYPCDFVQVSLWTLFAMCVIVVVVVFVSFCYCCCNCSCRKERHNYTLL